jgi:hypothetical protein
MCLPSPITKLLLDISKFNLEVCQVGGDMTSVQQEELEAIAVSLCISKEG